MVKREVIREDRTIFKSRFLEVIVFLVVGFLFFWLGKSAADVNYAIFFYLMSAMFWLAVFRPNASP